MRTDLWYLAHPVTPDDEHTFEQNLEHTRKMLRVCHTKGFYAIAPWYGMVEAYKEWRGTPEYAAFRELGLGMDEQTVAAFGNIILTGHILSSGMRRELDVIYKMYPHTAVKHMRFIDCVGMDDSEIPLFLEEKRKKLIDGRFVQATV
jgi:hypothetical protein